MVDVGGSISSTERPDLHVCVLIGAADSASTNKQSTQTVEKFVCLFSCFLDPTGILVHVDLQVQVFWLLPHDMANFRSVVQDLQLSETCS